MKSKYHLVNLKAYVRALFVMTITSLAVFLGGVLLGQLINALYFITNLDSFWRGAFYFLSANRYFFGFCTCIVGAALFSGWILAPVFDNLTGVVSSSLNFSGEKPEKVILPKAMKGLEEELNSINRELRLWKYAAKEAEQRKDDLVVYLAHDIRTPLTSVLGYLELLTESPDLPEEQRVKYTQVALRKAGRMQLLVEELFEVTRFHMAGSGLEKTEVNGEIMIQQLTEELMPLLEEREIALEMRVQSVKPMFIDPEKMARALDNILHNAAYYTPRGGIVRVELEDVTGGGHVIRISNTGAEISQEKLDHFFEKFFRGDEARRSGTGGSGLGLAIAKNIIEAHTGSITATNRERLTTFTILLA